MGLLVGLVISPAALPVAAVGAATGAIVAKLRRSGLGDDVAASLSRRLDAGEVLVCALGEDPEIETLARQARLRGFENVVVPATTRDVLEELSGLPDDLAF